MYYFIKYNSFEDIKKIRIPILALNGTMDLQVIADLNLPKIEEAAQASGNTSVKIEYLEGLNHLFQYSKTGNLNEYGQIEETFSIDVLKMMKKWILEQ